jgi:hypothetical protein
MFGFAVRFGNFQFGRLLAIALSFSIWPAVGRAYTAEEQQACSGDAFRLCGPEIPDVDRVTACMVRNKSQLTPGCRVYFGPDDLPPVAAKPLSIKAARDRKPQKPKTSN